MNYKDVYAEEEHMGDKVKGLMAGYIEELEGRGARRAAKPVTFSMRLSERDHAMLVWLARNLDVPKTPLAEQLLKAAVEEAIEEYAAWAAPEDDPEKFLEQARSETETRPEKPGGPKAGGPKGKPRKPGPRHPK
jgi:hypothetical protein